MLESFEYTRLGGWRVIDDLYSGEGSLESHLIELGFDNIPKPDIGDEDCGMRVQVFCRLSESDPVSDRGHAYLVKVLINERLNVVGAPNFPDLLALLAELTPLCTAISLDYHRQAEDTGWTK